MNFRSSSVCCWHPSMTISGCKSNTSPTRTTKPNCSAISRRPNGLKMSGRSGRATNGSRVTGRQWLSENSAVNAWFSISHARWKMFPNTHQQRRLARVLPDPARPVGNGVHARSSSAQGNFRQRRNARATMTDLDHFKHYKTFLNPSLADRFDFDAAQDFQPELSVQENCWHSEGNGQSDFGFYLDAIIIPSSRSPAGRAPPIRHHPTTHQSAPAGLRHHGQC